MQKTRRWFETGEWPSGGESSRIQRSEASCLPLVCGEQVLYLFLLSGQPGRWVRDSRIPDALHSLLILQPSGTPCAPALTATPLLLSILSLGMMVTLMFAQQLCTCLPMAEAETPFVRAFLWGLKKWLDALLWLFLRAGLLYSNWCLWPQAQMRRIFLKIFSHGKSLYENSYRSCFFLCKWRCIFHSWEMSENCSRDTKFQQEPWRLSWHQYYLDLVACGVQMMKSQSGTNPVSPP